MGRRKKLIDKQILKKEIGRCLICSEKSYNLLDVHRIIPGSEQGEYTDPNSVVLCSNCHRRVHAGEIEIHRYFNSTAGKVLHVTIDKEEKFIPKYNFHQ